MYFLMDYNIIAYEKLTKLKKLLKKIFIIFYDE